MSGWITTWPRNQTKKYAAYVSMSVDELVAALDSLLRLVSSAVDHTARLLLGQVVIQLARVALRTHPASPKFATLMSTLRPLRALHGGWRGGWPPLSPLAKCLTPSERARLFQAASSLRGDTVVTGVRV